MTDTAVPSSRAPQPRVSPWTLAAGGALLLHAVAFAWITAHQADWGWYLAGLVEGRPDRDPPTLHLLRVGRADSQDEAQAWVAHDDPRELLAPPAATDQPGLQMVADPTDNAPAELDPTPPADEPAPQPAPAEPPPAPAPMPDEPMPPAEADIGATPVADPTPPPPPAPPALLALESPATQQTEPPTQLDRPTSLLRSDREAPPSRRLDRVDWNRAGSLTVGEGIEVKTIAPRFGVIAYYSIPRNPELVISFDGNGQPLRVAIVASSGYENIDGPVLAALYKWRASGEEIDALTEGQTLDLPVRMFLRGE